MASFGAGSCHLLDIYLPGRRCQRRLARADPSGAELRDITRLVDEGTLRPQVGAGYPPAEARYAFMAKSTKHIPGKVVLTP
jgi:NADPH:quinone reductase-like Zn-dependent oxidoreductase